MEPFYLDYEQFAKLNIAQPAPVKIPEKYLDYCKGRACPKCNACRDWHRVGTVWTLMDGGTCTASRGYIYLHYSAMCGCKTYY